VELAWKFKQPSIETLKEQVTSREFIEWCVYFDEFELNEFHREDWYIAKLLQYLDRPYWGKGKSKQVAEYLIKFVCQEMEEKKPLSPEEKQKRIAYSKAAWKGAVVGSWNLMQDAKDKIKAAVMPKRRK
jgi:hypothetical protein